MCGACDTSMIFYKPSRCAVDMRHRQLFRKIKVLPTPTNMPEVSGLISLGEKPLLTVHLSICDWYLAMRDILAAVAVSGPPGSVKESGEQQFWQCRGCSPVASRQCKPP